MRLAPRRALASLVVAFAFAALTMGCPPPAPTPPSSPPPAPAPATPTPPPGAPDKPAPPTPGDEPKPADAPRGGTEAVIPDEIKKDLPPIFQATSTWPKADGLGSLPAANDPKRPNPTIVDRLKDDIRRCLAPELRPADFDKASGVDTQGKLFCRIGRDGARAPGKGLASTELGPKANMVFSVTLSWTEPVANLDAKKVGELVKKIVVKELAAEIETKDHELQPNPTVARPDAWAGLALLDRNGFGLEFPYLYVFAQPTKLTLSLQRVAHGTAPK